MNSIIGKKFGKLLVLERLYLTEDEKRTKSTFWLCICDCGEEVTIRKSNLTNGNAKSCGCFWQ